MEDSAVPDQVQRAPNSDQSKLNTANDKVEWWKPTGHVSAVAKLFLRAAKESADAFPPLKSLVGGLCFILDNYEVWHFSSAIYNAHSPPPANKGKQAGNRVIGA